MKALRFLSYFRNFYVFTGTLALVWMLFFDRYNLISQYKQYRRVAALEAELRFCAEEKARIADMGVLDEENFAEMERYAREHYWMKKDDEEVFIIVKPEQ